MGATKASRKAKQVEAEQAKHDLLKLLKPGDTVYCILRHVSRSGMMRVIDPFVLTAAAGQPWLRPIGSLAARALGAPYDRDRRGVRVGGCGMDIGFHLVYSLASTLWPIGYGCTGEKCWSNDHSNGDRDYTPDESARCIADECGELEEYHLHKPSERCAGCLAPRDHHAFAPGRRHWHRDGGYALRKEWV